MKKDRKTFGLSKSWKHARIWSWLRDSNGYVSRILWVISAIFLIVKYGYNRSIDKTRLLSYPKFDKALVIVLMLSMCYVIVSMFLVHKGFFFNDSEWLELVIIKFMLVGFVGY